MSSLSALTSNTSSLAALMGSSSNKGTSAATAFARNGLGDLRPDRLESFRRMEKVWTSPAAWE